MVKNVETLKRIKNTEWDRFRQACKVCGCGACTFIIFILWILKQKFFNEKKKTNNETVGIPQQHECM